MIDKEKVRELADLIVCSFRDPYEIITEWLEQNQPSPVVVGLSDEQVEDLASDLDSWNIGDTDGFIFHIKEWLKAQTFVQPESKEVVVGLSDEQVKDFSRLYGLTATQQNRLNANLTDFLKTQTFAQPRAFDDSELSEKYMSLYDDYQSLLIDLSLQRFERVI